MADDDRQRELGHFLRDRRSRVQPADVGLPSGARRRVAGLRREEVATLAGVGVSWYTMLENGTAPGVSLSVLTAIARALHLDAGETDYLTQLAFDDRGTKMPNAQPSRLTQATLDAIVWAPAYICTSQWNVLAWNGAMSLVWGIDAPGGAPFNIVERMFLDAHMRAMHGERFGAFARALVAMVRSGAGRRLGDPEYRRIYETLREDDVFCAAWDAYDVARPVGSIPTHVESAAIGTFAYETITLMIPDESEHGIVVQIPDDASAARLRAALSA